MKNNKQQTAVEWFSVRRDVLEIEVRLGKLSPIEYAEELTKAEQQAKEMEKEQIEEAFANGVDDEYEWHINNVPRKNSETYYNETYGGEQ
jgi:hypothetical protein